MEISASNTLGSQEAASVLDEALSHHVCRVCIVHPSAFGVRWNQAKACEHQQTVLACSIAVLEGASRGP
eukprot:scaffold45161_cov39-Tisochrysis_lutea.AAC.1